ncbi:MAG: hypothetical protein MUF71_07010 [Candidatus Kapabacteria bacterium]|jgi:hypothetical protein|nr:hypothetical protein [Candidatus Kapabacteria bacterium]
MNRFLNIASILAFALIAFACTKKTGEAKSPQTESQSASELKNTVQIPAEFWQFWSDGKAEISTYKGTQVRYNEERPCTSVLIFVSEPFNAEKQVKADAPDGSGIYTSVLKLNHVKRFQTGIYAYSLMTSVFTPLTPTTVGKAVYNPAAPLKITFSGQEWCGMVFHQLNRQADKSMLSHSRSYFEVEGDKQESFAADDETLFGDDVFIAVREVLKPLATGKRKFYHTLEHARISHKALMAAEVTVSKSDAMTRFRGADVPVTAWTLAGENFEWKFTVEKQYPRRILAFQFAENGRVIEQAELHESARLPYWKLNATADEHYLQELGLTK